MVKFPQAVPFFGTSRKGSQSPKGGLVSASLIYVSVISFFVLFLFSFFWFEWQRFEGEEFRGQKSSSRWLHSPFYNGEYRVSVKCKRNVFKKGSNRASFWKVFE